MSNVRNFESLDQGTSLTITFKMVTELGVPFNLTGYDARLQARRTYGARAEINATLMNGQLVWVSPVLGTLEWRISPADTINIKFNEKDDESLELVYDLEVISPVGKVERPARGVLTLNREVTR